MSNATSQPSNFDDGTIKWRKVTSKNGTAFEIGTRKTEGVVEESAVGSAHAGVAVNWTDTDGQWKDTTQEVKDKVAISKYMLRSNAGEISNSTFGFVNTTRYNYTFLDKNDDTYRVPALTTGQHYLRFSSSNITIVYVSVD